MPEKFWKFAPNPTIPGFARVLWVLRIATALCFIGHGAFGFITKSEWLVFFRAVGIDNPSLAYGLMPWIGLHDVLLGLLVLWRPVPALIFWMGCWGFWTALLRPLAGMPWSEFFERAGNYGIPWAYWFVLRCHARGELASIRTPLIWMARVSTFLLLAGHGALMAVTQKPVFVRHLASVGMDEEMVREYSVLSSMGYFEIVLALLALLMPIPVLGIFICGWKLATEFLYPLSGDYVWEFIERGGSYGAPLVLFLMLAMKSQNAIGAQPQQKAIG